MRSWQLTVSDPYSLGLAADVRQFQTDDTDDQIWRLELGSGEAPALALTTRYGGRCGLARIVPVWVVGDRLIYETTAYARPPIVHEFYPNYICLTAQPLVGLTTQVEAWAVESHVLAGRFTLRNESDQPLAVGVDLFAQLALEGQPGQTRLLELRGGQAALQLVDVGNLEPVVLLEGATRDAASPRLSTRITIAPGEQAVVRWVHAGLTEAGDSIRLAHYWLTQEDWTPHLQRVRDLNAALPIIETGDTARDAAIASSYRVALRSFVGPTDSLPFPSFVSARTPSQGFIPRSNGPSAAEALWLLPVVAQVAPALAKGALRNFIAVADEKGFIAAQPGMDGQRAGLLSAPLLATTAWRIYEQTEDRAFAEAVFPVLGRFFERWFQPDHDRDGDGLPEWDSVTQTGFVNHPTFVLYRREAGNIDIQQAETPQLAAYLIREGQSLLALADVLGRKKAIPVLRQRVEGVQAALAELWNPAAGSYQYRDYLTHASPAGTLIAEGPGDQTLIPSLELDPPNRLIVRVLGGRDHRPSCRVLLEGIGLDGAPISETLPDGAFVWHRGLGAATTAQVYARIDRISAEGLSRVYTVQVSGADWTRQDVTLLLPLWAGIADEDRRDALITTLTDPARYWRPNGVASLPSTDPHYDSFNGDVVRLAWNALLAEGLIDVGRTDLAAALFTRILDAQVQTLTVEKQFRAPLNSDEPGGLGEPDGVMGIVPLDLLWRLLGLRIVSSRRVWIGGEYALPWPVKVQQHGITVERTAKSARITFPSGEVKRVRSAKWRAIDDPAQPAEGDAVAPDPPAPFTAPPAPSPQPRRRTVRVAVQDGDQDE